MKKLLIPIIMMCCCTSISAQVKPVKKTTPKTIKKKTAMPATVIKKTISPADTATVPEININPAKMQTAKSFDPTNSKLSNLPIKTPVYNNMVTGTASPGDANSGISTNNTANYPPVNDALKDSIKQRN